jgi:O-antigen biosynthesis protein
MSISAIVPTYGAAPLLERCLASLRPQVDNIVVVDDGSPEPPVLKNVLYIKQTINQGFSVTCNVGAVIAPGEWLLFTNNDVELLPECVSRMMAVSTRRTIVGAKLLYPDQRIQHGGVFYDRNTGCFDHRHRFRERMYVPACYTDYSLVTGALILIHRDLFQELNGFSLDFSMSYEDIDLCLRALSRGAHIIYQGAAEAYHSEGSTRGANPETKQKLNGRWVEWEQQAQRTFHIRYPANILQQLATREQCEITKLLRIL